MFLNFFCLWKIWEPWPIRDILDFAKYRTMMYRIGFLLYRTIILAFLVDLLSLMICAKIQLQGILGSGEDFLRFLPYMDMATILVKRPQPQPFKQSFVTPI